MGMRGNCALHRLSSEMVKGLWKRRDFRPATQAEGRFVKGHDFSRADRSLQCLKPRARPCDSLRESHGGVEETVHVWRGHSCPRTNRRRSLELTTNPPPRRQV
jgi:hypothetical protein